MPVQVLVGDLFQSDAQTLVNTVNCVGVMGKGVALEFKRQFPEMYKDYVARCRLEQVRLGQPYLYRYPNPPWVLNFPTKDHWRNVARIEDVVRGLEYLLEHYKDWGITSLAVPPLGCGQGQLEWRVVGPTLHEYLTRMDIPVQLYAPFHTPPEQLQLGFMRRSSKAMQTEPERIRPGWVALADILRRVEEQPYHWPTGRIMFQKLAYVATEEGLPTGLKFVQASYGPFSDGLKEVTAKLINNGLIREEHLGRMMAVRTGRTLDDARKAYAARLAEWEPIIERTSNLFMRLNTEQAEIVATVIFAARHLVTTDGTPTEMEVYHAVMDWKVRRRPPLSGDDVAAAVRNLAALGWIKVTGSDDLPIPESEIALV